jgi:hypothetical protein
MKCNIKRKRAEEKVDSAYKTIGKTILAFLDAVTGTTGERRMTHEHKSTVQ